MKMTQTQKEVAAAESELLLVLVERLRNDLTKWDELVQMAGSSTTLGTEWAGGKYNDAEELAAAAVADAHQLNNAMDTELYASIRTIADFVQMPYARLLTYYTKHYILTGSVNGYCSYVPHTIHKEWLTERTK